MTRFIVVFCLSVAMGAQLSHAQMIDENCNILEHSCEPTEDCNFSLEPVDLNCGLYNESPEPRRVDPNRTKTLRTDESACEIDKLVQQIEGEITAISQQLECKRKQEQERVVCLSKAQQASLICKTKASALKASVSKLSKLENLVLDAEKGPVKSVPQEVIRKLADKDLHFTAFALTNLTLAPYPDEAQLPPFAKDKDHGFTVGRVTFLKDFEDPNKLPIRFWLEQNQVASMFSIYGIDELAVVMDADRKRFSELIERNVSDDCMLLGC